MPASGWFHLKKYGSKLITPAALDWMRKAAITIFMMCAVEGTTWGLLTYLILPEHVWFLSIVAGLMVATMMWSFDTTFMNTDVSGKSNKKRLLSKLLRISLPIKNVFYMVARIAIIVGMLYVTIPFLSQIILYPDIGAIINKHNESIKVEAIDKINAEYEPKIAELESKIEEANTAIAREVAGKGISGLHGDGDVAKALREGRDQLKRRLETLSKEYHDRLNTINNKSPEEIAAGIGKEIEKDTITSRHKIYNRLINSGAPYVDAVTNLVKVLFGLIFTALLMLKVLQPRAIDIYQDDYLQTMYTRYEKGGLDRFLSKEEQINGEDPMDPFRFQDWVYKVFPEAYKVQDAYHRISMLERDIQFFEGQVVELEDAMAKSSNQCDELDKQLSKVEHYISKISKDIATLKSKLNESSTMMRSMQDNPPHSSEEHIVNTYYDGIRQKKNQCDSISGDINQLEIELDLLQREERRLKSKLEELAGFRQNRAQELAQVRGLLTTKRNQLLELRVSLGEFND